MSGQGTAQAQEPAQTTQQPALGLFVYLLVGMYFGTVMIKSEAASWYRIQEMFRFQDFHMFGLIGSAVLTGIISTALLRRFASKSLSGETISVPPKEAGWRRYVFGGSLFGVGWGLAGVCPGPVFALLGSGVWGMLVVLAFALLGTYLYGVLRSKLPH